MAKLFNGSINFPSTMKPTGAQPLDDRSVVKSLTDLLAADTFGSAIYNGMMVAVVDEQQVFMLVDKTKATSEEGWVAVGAGNGSVAVETYAEAIALATDDNIGQVIYVKTKSSYDADGEEGEGAAVEYDAAPYIVIGNGTLQKLAASTASGDIEGDVAELATKVSNLETRMGDAEGDIQANADAIVELVAEDAKIREDYVNADAELKSELEGKIDTKVSSETYEGKISEIEGTISANDTKAQGYANTAKNEAIEAAATDATNKANAAQAAAEATAAADATSKANTAEQNAKDYADGLNTAMNTRVEDLEKSKDDYKTADETLKGEINVELAKKVDVQEGYRLISANEASKLAAIEENADVNVIEIIKVDGNALTVDADKAVNIVLPTIPVKGVNNKEGQIITLDNEGVLDTTLTIDYVKASETEKAQLRLLGVNGAVVSQIDATDFIKDGMVDNVALTGPKGEETGQRYLEITWNLASGKEVMRLDVSDLFNPYNAGNGLDLNDGKFSIKLKANEQYLSVGVDGLSTTQALWDEVNRLDTAVLNAAKEDATSKANAAQAAAIAAAATDATNKANAAQAAAEATAAADATTKANTAKSEAISAAETKAKELADAAQAAAIAAAADDATSKANTAEQNAKGYADDLNTAMNTRVEALEAIDHEHENQTVLDGITADKVNAWDAAEQNAKTYADGKFVTLEGFNEFEAEYEEKLNGIAAGAEVNVIESVEVNGQEASIEGKKASVKVEAKDIELGEAIKNGEEVKYEATAKISTVLQSIQESIRGAIAGGVNSVSSGDKAIAVNSADANNPVITLNTEESTETTVAAGHIELVKGDAGLYGVMYYEGDDVE